MTARIIAAAITAVFSVGVMAGCAGTPNYSGGPSAVKGKSGSAMVLAKCRMQATQAFQGAQAQNQAQASPGWGSALAKLAGAAAIGSQRRQFIADCMAAQGYVAQ